MVITKTFSNNVKVHALQTGNVNVKKEHFQYSGNGILRFPKILFSNNWNGEMPIWTWVIETNSGNYLIDTGESIDFYNSNHFKTKTENFIYRKMLQFNVKREEEIDQQLKKIGLSTNSIDAVILTHLHLDHVDGVKYFYDSKFLVSKIDWDNPSGVPTGKFPKWFKPELILCEKSNDEFRRSYSISKNIKLISTPGHTIGHQSALLNIDNYFILFAGDMTFSEQQLLYCEVGGINMNITKSKNTIKEVQNFSNQVNLIYLPSHDPKSGERLAKLKITKCK